MSNDTDLVSQMQRTGGVMRFHVLEGIGLATFSEQQITLRISTLPPLRPRSGQVSMALVEHDGSVSWGECIELEHSTADAQDFQATSGLSFALVDDCGVTRHATEFTLAQFDRDKVSNGYLTWDLGLNEGGDQVAVKFAFEFVVAKSSPLSGLVGTLQISVKSVRLAAKGSNAPSLGIVDQENEVDGANNNLVDRNNNIDIGGDVQECGLIIVVNAHQPLRRGTGTNTSAPSRLCKTHALATSAGTRCTQTDNKGNHIVEFDARLDIPGAKQTIAADCVSGVMLGMSLWRTHSGGVSHSLIGDAVLDEYDVADAVAEGGQLHIRLSPDAEAVCTAQVIELTGSDANVGLNEKWRLEDLNIVRLRVGKLLLGSCLQKGYAALRLTSVQSGDVVWQSSKVAVNTTNSAIKWDDKLPPPSTTFGVLQREGSLHVSLWINQDKVADSLLTFETLQHSCQTSDTNGLQVTLAMTNQKLVPCGELMIIIDTSSSSLPSSLVSAAGSNSCRSTAALQLLQSGVRLAGSVSLAENTGSSAVQGTLKLHFKTLKVVDGNEAAGISQVYVRAQVPLYGINGKTPTARVQQPNGTASWDTHAENAQLSSAASCSSRATSHARTGTRGGRLRMAVTWSASQARIPELVLTVHSDDNSGGVNQTWVVSSEAASLDLSPLFLFPGNIVERSLEFRSNDTTASSLILKVNMSFVSKERSNRGSHARNSADIARRTAKVRRRSRSNSLSYSVDGNSGRMQGSLHIHVMKARCLRWNPKPNTDGETTGVVNTNTHVEIRVLSDPSNSEEFHASTQVDVGGGPSPSFDEHFIIPLTLNPATESISRVVTFQVRAVDNGDNEKLHQHGSNETLCTTLPVFESLTSNGELVDGWLPLHSISSSISSSSDRKREDAGSAARKCGDLRVSMQFVPSVAQAGGNTRAVASHSMGLSASRTTLLSGTSTNCSFPTTCSTSNNNSQPHVLSVGRAVLSQPSNWAGNFSPLVAVRDVRSNDVTLKHSDALVSLARTGPARGEQASSAQSLGSKEYIWNETISVASDAASVDPCFEILIVNTNTVRSDVVLGRGTVQWGDLVRSTDTNGVWVEVRDMSDRKRTLGRVQVKCVDSSEVVMNHNLDVKLNGTSHDDDVVGYLYAATSITSCIDRMNSRSEVEDWDVDNREYQLVLEVQGETYARSPWFKAHEDTESNSRGRGRGNETWTRLVVTNPRVGADKTNDSRLILRSRDKDEVASGLESENHSGVVEGIGDVDGVVEYVTCASSADSSVNERVEEGGMGRKGSGGEWTIQLTGTGEGDVNKNNSSPRHVVRLVYLPVVSNGSIAIQDVEVSAGAAVHKLTSSMPVQENPSSLPVIVKAILVWPNSTSQYAMSSLKAMRPPTGLSNGSNTSHVSRVSWRGEKWHLQVCDKTNHVAPPMLLLQAWHDDSSDQHNLLGQCVVQLETILRSPGRAFEMTRSLRDVTDVTNLSTRGTATGFAITFQCTFVSSTPNGTYEIQDQPDVHDVKRFVGLRRLKDIFNRVDRDKSGTVSAAELSEALENRQLMDELETLFGNGTRARFVKVIRDLNRQSRQPINTNGHGKRRQQEMTYGAFLQVFQLFLDQQGTRMKSSSSREAIDPQDDSETFSFEGHSEHGRTTRRSSMGSTRPGRRLRRSSGSASTTNNTRSSRNRRPSSSHATAKTDKQALQRRQSVISESMLQNNAPDWFAPQQGGDQALPGAGGDDMRNKFATTQGLSRSTLGSYPGSANYVPTEATAAGPIAGAETQLELYLAKELQAAQMQTDELEAAREQTSQRLGQQKAIADQLRSSLGSTVHTLMSLQKDKYVSEAKRRWRRARELAELRAVERVATDRQQRLKREETAAAKLQAVRRGAKARTQHHFKMAARVSAVIKIQSLLRARREAALVAEYRGEVKDSAVRIQRHFRGAKVRATTNKNQRAATKIQTGYRAIKQRRVRSKQAKLFAGATKIQSHARRVRATRRVDGIRQIRVRDQSAATLIQSAFRDMKRRDEEFVRWEASAAATGSSGDVSGTSEIDPLFGSDDTAVTRAAAVVLQRRVRGFVSKGAAAAKRDQAQAAARTTQRVVRGQQQKQKYTRLVTLAAHVPRFQGVDPTAKRQCDRMLAGSLTDVVEIMGSRGGSGSTVVDGGSVQDSLGALGVVAGDLKPSYNVAFTNDPSALSYQLKTRLDKLRRRLLGSSA